jgi:hypothetical protein
LPPIILGITYNFILKIICFENVSAFEIDRALLLSVLLSRRRTRNIILAAAGVDLKRIKFLMLHYHRKCVRAGADILFLPGAGVEPTNNAAVIFI